MWFNRDTLANMLAKEGEVEVENTMKIKGNEEVRAKITTLEKKRVMLKKIGRINQLGKSGE